MLLLLETKSCINFWEYHIWYYIISWNLYKFNYSHPANGFAWIVTEVILASVRGLNVFGLTGIFSKSSNASKPSITLKQESSI